MGKDSLLLWEGGRGPNFQVPRWVIWFGGRVVLSWVKTSQSCPFWGGPLRKLWFDISAPRSWKWWGGMGFLIWKMYITDVKKGFQPHFWEVWGRQLGSSVEWTKNAEEEVLKPLLSRAAWELVQELPGGEGVLTWSLGIFFGETCPFPATVATRTGSHFSNNTITFELVSYRERRCSSRLYFYSSLTENQLFLANGCFPCFEWLPKNGKIRCFPLKFDTLKLRNLISASQ